MPDTGLLVALHLQEQPRLNAPVVAPPANSDSKFEESEHVHCSLTIEFRLSVLANTLATVGEPLFATTLQPHRLPATTVINAACRSKFQ
eukprot:scaffold89874_cov60-Phaeocystis_antarctica.AAC.1